MAAARYSLDEIPEPLRASSTVKRDAGRRSLTVTIPRPCSKLLEEDGRSRCGIYDARPLTCREYNCLEDDDIGDTAWKRYIREQRARGPRSGSHIADSD